MSEQEQGPEIREQTLVELEEIVTRFTSPESDEVLLDNLDKRLAMAEKFKTEHANWADYILYHVLAGGSTPREDATVWDTPDHELENIIRSLPDIK